MYQCCVVLCCVGRACFLVQTHAQVACRAVSTDGNSRDAHHHECPLWASLRYNTGLLISHWINFILSTNLFCDTIHRSKLLLMLWSTEALRLYIRYSNLCFKDAGKECCSIFAFLQILQWLVHFKRKFTCTV